MTSEQMDSYLSDPLLNQALTNFQKGAWEAGLEELDQLVKKYPLSQPLRSLRQEMKIRSSIDADEITDHRDAFLGRLKFWALRLGLFVAIVAAAAWGIWVYSARIQEQLQIARNRVESEIMTVELAVKFRDGQDLLQVGRFGEAQVLFDEVAARDPNYPGLEQAFQQTEKMITMEEQYTEAVQLMDQGDMSAALDKLESIQSQEPYYKDISIRISEIKGQVFLGDLLAQADKVYQDQNWVQAASSYETLRALNPSYNAELVDQRLFDSYMNAAVAALAQDSESLEALDIAEEYFSKALTLRPQDPVIKTERENARQGFKDRLYSSYITAANDALTQRADSLEALSTAEEYYRKALALKPGDPLVDAQQQLAKTFITALDYFDKGNWTEVITSLEIVYAEDPVYASGTATQTLYDAYIARGNAALQSTFYEDALNDYQRAAALAGQGPESALKLFQAQMKIAEIQGFMGEYENAVVIFRAAIESANLDESEMEKRPDVVSKMNQADQYAKARSYRSAYRLYRDAARLVFFILPQVTHVVQSGEYITQIASQYHTTVEAIAQANNLGSTRKITPGRPLTIPVQP